MCGFCGIFTLNGSKIDIPLLKGMTQKIRHRGPDDEGFVLIDTENNVFSNCFGEDTVDEIKGNTKPIDDITVEADLAFGFRRLAIIDLTPKGHQPMFDEESGIWIVFNGEIYNYIELREELKGIGYDFNSNTDTEVIIKSYREWGIKCLDRFNGMWAFVIWDARKKSLFCCRDRFGIKPFYFYHKEGESFIFASEIKCILQIIKARADYSTISEFLGFGYIDHSEKTFFREIRQLRGSHFALVNRNKLAVSKYYDLKRSDYRLTEDISIEKFGKLFFDAVKIRLRSDVEVGYALSGGLDSSAIVMAASEISSDFNNNTFSTVYPNNEVDESFYINKVLEKTGFKNYFIQPTADMLIKDIDKFIWHQEEPNNGTSYFAEFMLRSLIRERGVTVSLEGQGADEIITGYKSLISPYLKDLIKSLKLTRAWNDYHIFKRNLKISKLELIAGIVSATCDPLYNILRRRYMRHLWSHLDWGFISSQFSFPKHFNGNKTFSSALNQVLYNYLFYTTIPPQLVRADKSAMAFSVECRFPFLDYRLVEFAFSLPSNLKIRDGVTKYVLREAMKQYLPAEVYGRYDKKGFPTPQKDWFRGSMKVFISDIVYSNGFRKLPFIKWKQFEKKYNLFQKGEGDFDTELWSLLSIFLWQKKFIEKESAGS